MRATERDVDDPVEPHPDGSEIAAAPDPAGSRPGDLEQPGFDDWYAASRPKVLATVALWCGSLDAASEAVDEAYVRALYRWARVASMASPTGWVVTVATNVVRRQARRRALERTLLRRHAERPATDLLPSPADETFDAVGALAPRQRTIVLLRYVADLPQAEIAAALGISRSAVSTALTDAHRNLRLALDPDARQDSRHDDRSDDPRTDGDQR